MTRNDDPTRASPFAFTGPADPEARVGLVLRGRFRLTRLLGKGGMGCVYQALDEELNRNVAIKMMKASLTATPNSPGRFYREAQALSLLQHRNIVEVFDFGIARGEPFLVMEYLEGVPLSSWMTDRRPPPLGQVASFLDQSLDALQVAHEAGIIHRDIKPDNLFLLLPFDGPRPWFKVLDFGLAHIDAAIDQVGKITSTGTVAGTPSYMSPEQCRSLSVTPASDLYSLGCVLTELLQGKPPFEAPCAAELMTLQMFEPVPPLARPTGEPPVPPLLDELRRELLAKRPERRPASAAEARRLLREAMAPEGWTPPHP